MHLPSWPAGSELGTTPGFLLSISEMSGSKWLRETEAARCSGVLKGKKIYWYMAVAGVLLCKEYDTFLQTSQEGRYPVWMRKFKKGVYMEWGGG